jgi:hypothetical protein
MVVQYNAFIKFCKEQIGKEFPTIGKRSSFKVESVNEHSINYLLSTGNERVTERGIIQKILDKYEETHSFKVKDYKDISFAASYTLSLLSLFTEKYGN